MPVSLEQDVALLRQSLGVLPEPVAWPALVVVSGLPGSGKSTFSRELSRHLPLAIVESDALRQAMFPVPIHSAEESTRLFAALHRLVEQLLREGVPTLLDATNLQERHRERLYHVTDHLRTRLILVWVKAPETVIQERLRWRQDGADPRDRSTADVRVYERMAPSAQRITRSHFVVDTSRDISPVVDRIVRELRRTSREST